MPSLKILIYLCACLLFVGAANAATIYGSVYDMSLKKADNARVEINTLPRQFVVAQNGSYSFNAPNGAYTIKAEMMRKNAVFESVEENITVKQDGAYVVDLILFPNVEEGVEEINVDAGSTLAETAGIANKFFAYFIAIIILLAILGAVLYLKKYKKIRGKAHEAKQEQQKESGDTDLEQLIKIIRHEGGRATQKDIRKQIPLSEAKISLMIAELEHKGVIEKIRKGRGNIIILKRK